MPAALGVERSFSGRRWKLREADEDVMQALSRSANISPVLARLLAASGVAPADANEHLNPSLKNLLPEPRRFKDMERAVARTREAITRGERIVVFGDYD